MPLKDKVSQAEFEAMSDDLKAGYIAGPEEDGTKTWVLDSAEAAGLKAQVKAKGEQIAAQRTTIAEQEQRLKALEETWAGIDPETARGAMAKAAELARDEYIKKNDIPGLLEAEEVKWKERHAKELEQVKAQLAAEEAWNHELMVKKRVREMLTSGKWERGNGDKDVELPVVKKELLDAAEALIFQTFKPEVIKEGTGDAAKRRSVVMQDGVPVDLSSFMAETFWPKHETAFALANQAEGGADGVGPGKTTTKPGEMEILTPEQASKRIRDVAEGRARIG